MLDLSNFCKVTMDSPALQKSIEDEVELQKDSDSDDGLLSKIISSSEKVRDLKLKELPLVHQTKKKVENGHASSSLEENPESWLIGGPMGSRNAVLRFRCSALSDPPAEPPANELHMTYKTIQAETKLLAAVLHSHGMREVHPNIPDFNLLWTGIHPKPHLLKAMTPYQRVNHFPRSYELTRKDRLYKNIEKMQHAKGAKHFDFIPQTFVMPMDFRELCSSHYRNRGPWIVKPVASSRGRGIYIVNSPDQVPLEETLVVAKYIDNPLLVDGHKCDLRLYVAVTSYDPLLVYMYEEGLVRFATVKYDSSGKHLWNPCMHLCNYSINKYHSDYIKSEDPEAEDVELYGFDILIDSALKPWLLEVNLSPSLGCDSPLDVRVKSAMLVDLLTLVGLPTVDPMLRRANESRRPTSQLDILKKLSCRRVQSADALSGSSSVPGKKIPPIVTSSRLIASSLSLSPEENRMIKTARAEFERRGGFVRIFPSAESWKRYGVFLDPVTGIPCTSAVPGGQCAPPMVVPHNYNLLLHQQLFPELQSSSKGGETSMPTERFTRYERALLQGHKASLDEKQLDKSENDDADAGEERKEASELKTELGELLHNTLYASFEEFLDRIKRIPLLKIMMPSRKLAGKDRVAVVAKQLNDFIYLYNRETDLYSEGGDRPNFVPSKLYQRFLSSANEQDLEDVLSVQTKLYKCAHLYLGRSGPTPNSARPFGLLRSLPYSPGNRERADCECSGAQNRKTLPRLSKKGTTTMHPPRASTASSSLPSTATGATGKRQSLKISRAL
ncbi:hypothetical protein C0J52_21196 [Blattella germanica]|nr:hypothetical protein C0J52_21196 [Blattella germanica]